MRRRTAIAMLVVSMVVAAVIIIFWPRHSPGGPPGTLQVCFQTYSNSPTGKRYALFAATNWDNCELELVGSDAIDFAGTNRYGAGYAVDLYPGTNLCRGCWCTICAEAPTNGKPWRLSAEVRRHSLKQALVDITGRIPFVPNYNNGCPDFFFFQTDWIRE